MKFFRYALVSLLIVTAAYGLSQQRFTGDIYSLLPADLAVVDALETQQEAFSRKQELLISLRSQSQARSEQIAEMLSVLLSRRDDVERVIWREPMDEESGLEAEMIAYRWLNTKPEAVNALGRRFDVSQLEINLLSKIEQASSSADPFAAAVLLGDPLDLLLPSDDDVAMESQTFISSADGTFRVLYVQPSATADKKWFSRIKRETSHWQLENAADVTLRYAGNPAFFQEFSSRLTRDLAFSLIVTALCVALLFWIAHRRFRPLLWMLALLALVLASTISIGGMLLGTLNVISLGYAAVLMGLAADYGLILYQEHRVHRKGAAETSRAVAPSILWAGLTTAGAFVCISRGSLPGMTQLGVLVALGVLIAAVVMIVLFLPVASLETDSTAERITTDSKDSSFLRPAASLFVLIAVSCIAVVVVWSKQPALDSSPETLGPAQTDSFLAMAEIQEQLERDESPLFLLFDAPTAKQVETAFYAVAPLLEIAVQKGVVDSWQVPSAIWPKPSLQRANLSTLLTVAESKNRFVAVANNLGLPEESQQLTITILDHFASMGGRSVPITASSKQGAWLLSQAIAASPERYLALGLITPNSNASQQQIMELQEKISLLASVQLAGWPLASPALLESMKADLSRVAIPMGILLLVVLLLAFRGIAEIVLSLTGLTFTLLVLVAIMSIFGWSFNLMNILAFPLLLGVTVDYSIHIQLALQRYEGDLNRVYATVGKAILLAGATTAIAFGSLAFANNEGLASLGKISAIGVVIACLFAVYILPGCWLLCRRQVVPSQA
jgi:predicted RND superfamily exporter protein